MNKAKVVPNASINGCQPAAVPGTTAGLYQVHCQYGLTPAVGCGSRTLHPFCPMVCYQSTLLRQPSDAEGLF